MRRSRASRRGIVTATAHVGLAAAAVLLTFRALPASHPRPRVRLTWGDGGTILLEGVVRSGLDRYGYVRQTRQREWTAPARSRLDGLRAAHAADPVPDLWPAQSWRLQLTGYGNNHAYLPGGLTLTEVGQIVTVPYTLAALACAAPAALLGVAPLCRRLRRRPAR